MKKASEIDIDRIIARNKLGKVSAQRRELCHIGCQLGNLYEEDIVYIADSKHSISEAMQRLRTRRLAD